MRRGHRRKYRAFVIDLRRAGRILILSLALALIFSIGLAAVKRERGEKTAVTEETPHENVLDISGKIKKVLAFFTGFDPSDYTTLLKNESALIGVTEKSAIWALASGEAASVYNPDGADTNETEPSPDKKDGKIHAIKEVDSSQAKSLSGTDSKILIKNETGFKVDVGKMLREEMPVKLNSNGPQILILHTHATESFTPEGETSYNSAQSDRTRDTEKNIVKVGEKMAEIFRENGIETIHDKTLHDYPNYNGSYGNSLKTAENYLKKYPSVKMIIDVHRDAIVYGDGTKAKVLTEIDGKKAAQLMFVIGTNAGGLEHPEWQKNLTLAVKLQAAIEQEYPGLMRGINLRKERFNEHLTKGSMIIEVGTSGNTLSEALYSSQLAARVIAKTLKSASN